MDKPDLINGAETELLKPEETEGNQEQMVSDNMSSPCVCVSLAKFGSHLVALCAAEPRERKMISEDFEKKTVMIYSCWNNNFFDRLTNSIRSLYWSGAHIELGVQGPILPAQCFGGKAVSKTM